MYCLGRENAQAKTRALLLTADYCRDAEVEAPILWLPDAKNRLIGKDADVGKDWRQEEKGMTEGEMVGWHHRLDRLDFE